MARQSIGVLQAYGGKWHLRCRPPYEEQNARISILVNGIAERSYEGGASRIGCRPCRIGGSFEVADSRRSDACRCGLWTRYQPGAAQVCWFRERVGTTGRRVRKIMVVALARKLLIALRRFVIDGVLPEGAVLKPAA